MTEYRAPRVWRIEARYGGFYAEDQFGGFMRRGSEDLAREVVERAIEANPGDAWRDGYAGLINELDDYAGPGPRYVAGRPS